MQETQKKNLWEEKGFIPELAKVCFHLEALEESTLLPKELNEIIERTASATRVEDFDDFTDEDIQNMINSIRNELPRYYNNVIVAIRDISQARPIVVDDDFI